MGSSQASPQRSSLEANATSYSNRPGGGSRRSLPIDNRPILLRDPDPAADLRPKQSELAQLLAGLISRDVAILAALDDHRYLDQEQVRELFFDGQRHAQIRTKWLRDQHLIQRWIALQPPGWHRPHSVLLISVPEAPKDRRWRLCEPNFHWHPSVVMIAPRGAAVVARAMDRDLGYLIELAHGASAKRSKFLRVLRVLRADWFFVDVAAAADPLRRHGLYHWVGVSDLRYEPRAGRHLERPISDGWGRFLTPDGDITFDLDWDRADLPKHFLQRRIDHYVQYSMDRRGAELAHVLFVARTEGGERSLVRAVRRSRRMFVDTCHRSWVTTMARLRRDGPLGPIWRYVPCLLEEPDEWQAPPPEQRLRLDQFPKKPLTDRDLRGCVGHPQWWTFRAAGAGGQ